MNTVPQWSSMETRRKRSSFRIYLDHTIKQKMLSAVTNGAHIFFFLSIGKIAVDDQKFAVSVFRNKIKKKAVSVFRCFAVSVFRCFVV